MMAVKVGVIGSGDVGKALGNGFLKHGFEVMLGSRNPEKLEEWKKQTKGNAKIGTFEETGKFGEIVVLAVKGEGAENALKEAGIKNLEGKTVIDVTNPIDHSKAPENGVLHYFTSLEESLMERLQKKAPKANFVKAFNSIGNAFMVNPDFGGLKPTMFICGNNEKSRKKVSEIVEKFGFDVVDMGKAEAARAIEPLCMLWCIPGLVRNEWAHGFKLLKK
ncbi:MAG TPA: NAD(P)-binding domain-containing protein [archaeon]|nr:NAD(P)-binding domain-containing protein [archaeon]